MYAVIFLGEQREPMRGVNFKAVVLATIATMGVDIIGGIVLMSVVGGDRFSPTMSDEQLRELTRVLSMSREFLMPLLVFGTLTTVLGGYLAARIAKVLPYMNSFAFGLLGILLGVVLRAENLPLWYEAFGFTATVPAALVGGHIAKQQMSRLNS